VSGCALWQGRRRLAAIIIDEERKLRAPMTAPATPSHVRHLLSYLATAGVDTLILAEPSHALLAQAHALKLAVRFLPRNLLEAIRTATGLDHRPPQHTALLLAHCDLIPALRVHLRDARAPAPQDHQLDLL
jgi:hypothetical protein